MIERGGGDLRRDQVEEVAGREGEVEGLTSVMFPIVNYTIARSRKQGKT
jgi:hypothetical protein